MNKTELKKFFGLYLNDVKREKGTLIFVNGYLILIIVLSYYMSYLYKLEPYYRNEAVGAASKQVFICSLILSFTAFADYRYLHKKNMADSVERLPIGKRAYLMEKILLGITKTMLPIICSAICGMIVFANEEGRVLEIAKDSALASVFVLANLALITLISVCCGKTVDAVVTFVVVNLFFSLFVLELGQLPEMIIPGIMQKEGKGFLEFFVSSSGIVMVLSGYVRTNMSDLTKWVIFFRALATVVMFVIGIVIVKYRKTEATENEFALAAIPEIIKIMSAVPLGIISGFLVVEFIGAPDPIVRYLLFYIATAVTVLLAYLVLHSIFHRGFHRFKKEFKGMAISFAIIAAIMTFVQTGAIGMDSKVPDAADIEYAYVEVDRTTCVDGRLYTSNDEERIAFEEGKEINKGKSETCSYEYVTVAPGKYAYEPDDVQSVIDLHKQIIDKLDDYKKLGLYKLSLDRDNNVDEDDLGKYSFHVRYKLKDGSEIEREYKWVDLSDEGVERLEAVRETGPLLFVDPGDWFWLYIKREGKTITDIDRGFYDTEEWCKQFKECYISEYEKLKNNNELIDKEDTKTYELEFGTFDDYYFSIYVSENMPKSYSMVEQLLKDYKQ